MDTALYDAGKSITSITWESGMGMGLDPGNLDFFGPQMALT
jgi:hypothetical protein